MKAIIIGIILLVIFWYLFDIYIKELEVEHDDVMSDLYQKHGKCKKIISSCTTQDQLEIAHSMYIQVFNRITNNRICHPVLDTNFRNIIWNKERDTIDLLKSDLDKLYLKKLNDYNKTKISS